MLRLILSAFAVLCLCTVTLVSASTEDAKTTKSTKEGKGGKHKAMITKVDAKAGTIMVKMKDKEGKTTTKTFKLAEDIHYFDSTGKAAVLDVFESGNEVLIVEVEGMLKEMHKAKGAKTTPKSSAK